MELENNNEHKVLERHTSSKSNFSQSNLIEPESKEKSPETITSYLNINEVDKKENHPILMSNILNTI